MTNRQEYLHVWNVRIKETGKLWTAVRMIWQSRFLSIKKKEGFRCFLHWLPDFVQDCWRFIFWLFLPYVRNLQEANQQIMKYSDAVSSQGAELTKAQSQAQESGDTVEAASKQIEEEKKKAAVMRL